MIFGFDEAPGLSKDAKQLVAAFGQGRQFDAVKELIEHEILVKTREIINNPATPADQRIEQIGRENGIIELLQRVRQIAADFKDD